jgi:hypothetical protein
MQVQLYMFASKTLVKLHLTARLVVLVVLVVLAVQAVHALATLGDATHKGLVLFV